MPARLWRELARKIIYFLLNRSAEVLSIVKPIPSLSSNLFKLPMADEAAFSGSTVSENASAKSSRRIASNSLPENTARILSALTGLLPGVLLFPDPNLISACINALLTSSPFGQHYIRCSGGETRTRNLALNRRLLRH